MASSSQEVYDCDSCTQEIETGNRWHCDTCQDYDVCDLCLVKQTHEHELVAHPVVKGDMSTNERHAHVKFEYYHAMVIVCEYFEDLMDKHQVDPASVNLQNETLLTITARLETLRGLIEFLDQDATETVTLQDVDYDKMEVLITSLVDPFIAHALEVLEAKFDKAVGVEEEPTPDSSAAADDVTKSVEKLQLQDEQKA